LQESFNPEIKKIKVQKKKSPTDKSLSPPN